MTSYDFELDQDTFDALICDCYREVHPPLQRVKIKGHWVQRPYHYDIEDKDKEEEGEK